MWARVDTSVPHLSPVCLDNQINRERASIQPQAPQIACAAAAGLKDHFEDLRFDTIELIPVTEAGLMKVRRKSDGPTDQEREAKKADQRKKAADRQRAKRAADAKAAGREVGQPGNPKLKKAKPT